MSGERQSSGKELSLIDLAIILLRRVRLFAVLFVLFVVAGIVYALMAPEQYEYVSMYQSAEDGDGAPIENPSTSLAILNSRKVPELEGTFKEENGTSIPFHFNFSSPESTGLVRIDSISGRDNTGLVKEYHDELLQYLSSHQNLLLEKARSRLTRRLETVKSSLESLRNVEGADRAVADAFGRQLELEGELAALTPGEVLVVARESVERVAPDRKLIVVLSAMLGFVFAVFAVYLVEFVSVVRHTIKEQSSL